MHNGCKLKVWLRFYLAPAEREVIVVGEFRCCRVFSVIMRSLSHIYTALISIVPPSRWMDARKASHQVLLRVFAPGIN